MKYNLGDSWDGFDGSEHVYDEKQERGFRTGIWKLLLTLSVLIMLYLITDHIKEIRLVSRAHMIEAEYFEDKGIAQYYDENSRQFYSYNLSGYIPEHKNGIVRLYYTDRIDYAVPKNSLKSRIFYYVFFGVILILCAWRVKKNS